MKSRNSAGSSKSLGRLGSWVAAESASADFDHLHSNQVGYGPGHSNRPAADSHPTLQNQILLNQTLPIPILKTRSNSNPTNANSAD